MATSCFLRRRVKGIGRAAVAAAGGLAVLTPAAARAHADAAPAPHDLWSTWTFDPWVLVPLALFVALYVAGALRLARKAQAAPRRAKRHTLFILGIAALLLALVAPLDGLGESLFSAHMAQHVVLMLLAAPLLVAAEPLPLLLHGLPATLRRRVAAPTARSALLRRTGGWLVRPFGAGSVQLALFLAWHAPGLFIAAQLDDGVHTVMHLSFLVAAVLYWWMVFRSAALPTMAPLAAALACVATMKVQLMFAIVILSADAAFYPEIYAAPAAAWSTTALADQQLAAMVMLAPGAIVYMAAAFLLVWVWIAKMEKRTAGPGLSTGE